MRIRFFLPVLSFIFTFSACTPSFVESTTSTVHPTPTTHPFFESNTSVPAFPTVDLTVEAIVATPTNLPPVLTGEEDPAYGFTSVFDEELNSNWGLEASNGLTYTNTDTFANTGEVSLEITGQEGSQLTFKVLLTSPERYLREQIISLSFWLYTGDNNLEVDQLVVEVLGSTNVFYWVRNDMSAIEELDTFSRKRMYGLGLNHVLEADTWVQIEILLDELVFDPNFDDTPVDDPFYDYMTGFSLHFVEGFSGTLYLDDVQLFLAEN